jgi:hypothetical protein
MPSQKKIHPDGDDARETWSPARIGAMDRAFTEAMVRALQEAEGEQSTAPSISRKLHGPPKGSIRAACEP